jgi:hypothetical protein
MTVGMLTCPFCGHNQQASILENSCQPFYVCKGCGKTVKAEKSCCVFCDYGDTPCPAAEKHKKK